MFLKAYRKQADVKFVILCDSLFLTGIMPN